MKISHRDSPGEPGDCVQVYVHRDVSLRVSVRLCLCVPVCIFSRGCPLLVFFVCAFVCRVADLRSREAVVERINALRASAEGGVEGRTSSSLNNVDMRAICKEGLSATNSDVFSNEEKLQVSSAESDSAELRRSFCLCQKNLPHRRKGVKLLCLVFL